ncbi:MULTISPECIES: endonuclease domain-containing protein [unclassified Mesorhizobium]|uniref:endonuclease domain-containing protein n=1 Tax=unclassified Mesorhizobium TaxID=325217 RepID=UPI001FD54BBE|nr:MULTISPECIES: endonuclease domain-containing protein [unclassified Mesorhizobium]
MPVADHVTKRRDGATVRARQLRQDDTEPEYRLWGELRSRRLNGYKFSRQIPIGRYFVDFVCRERLLVIELDGGQHSESARDDIRTRFLNAHGYSVLRFWNHEVLREQRAVLDTILAALEDRLARSPSPDLRGACPRACRRQDPWAPATLSPRGEEAQAGRPRQHTKAARANPETQQNETPSSPQRGEGGRSPRVLPPASPRTGSAEVG